MTDQALLDALLALIIVLFGLIGFWRGAAREGLVTAGVFTGAAIADAWARPWGGDLARLVSIRLGIAQLIVAGTALLLATTILGYGSGAVLQLPSPGLPSRLAGAVLAAVNGALMLRYGLRFIERFLAGDSTDRVLDDSRVSWLLLRQWGWLLVGGALVFGLAILLAMVINREAEREFAAQGLAGASYPHHLDVAPLQRPVRLPRQADEGKIEPASRGFDRASGTYATDAPRIEETIPITPATRDLGLNGGRSVPATAAWRDNAAQPGGYSSRANTARDEWLHWPQPQPVTQQASRPQDTQPPRDGSGWGQRHMSEPDAGAGRTGAQWGASPRPCRICGTELGTSDNFCPNCGASAR
jgi:uncharacterized membrane protein required for colicin V production